ncbi:MAG: glycosyltransferase [Pseudomonadota bacterium]
MIVSRLGDLPPAPARAIIINCSTRVVTTLALMSALKYANMPVLLIDCQSTDGSWSWFEALAQQHPFDLLRLPLKPHGKTLDRLFRESHDDALLLIDSDLEILQPDVIEAMRQAMRDLATYGAGFLHVGGAIHANLQPMVNEGRYMDRMWIPFCLLNVAKIRAVIAEGSTFMHSRDYLEFPWNKLVSRLLYARQHLPLFKRLSLEVFADARERIHGERFLFREYDTGARLHAAMLKQGGVFADLGDLLFSQSVRHYHGVTRATLVKDQENATAPDSIAAEVATRLVSEYAIRVG